MAQKLMLAMLASHLKSHMVTPPPSNPSPHPDPNPKPHPHPNPNPNPITSQAAYSLLLGARHHGAEADARDAGLAPQEPHGHLGHPTLTLILSLTLTLTFHQVMGLAYGRLQAAEVRDLMARRDGSAVCPNHPPLPRPCHTLTTLLSPRLLSLLSLLPPPLLSP